MPARSRGWGIFVSGSAVVDVVHQPPNGNQHPNHGLVGAAWSPMKIARGFG